MSESLEHRLAAAEATIAALLAGQIDAVVDPATRTPVLLATALEALRASEARYRGIVETSNEGIMTLDADGMTTFANQRLADLLGTTCAAMLGRAGSSFVVPDEVEQSIARQARTRRGISEDHDVTLRRENGDEIRVLLKTSPIRDRNGAINGSLAMITDRTRYWLDRSALRRSEDQYRQIVETTTDGIVTTNHAAVIVFANRRFAQLLGREARELVGRSHYDFLTDAARPLAIEAFERGIAHVDTIYRRADGSEVAVDVASSRVVDAILRTVGSLHVVRDVTERKQLQSQLMVSDRMASVGTLAAGVAHEINNPLAAVITNLDFIAGILAATPVALAELPAPLEDAREAAQRVRSIVRDLRIFARTPGEEEREAVDIHEVIETSLRMAWHETRHRARIERRFGPVPRVPANAGRLGQVFLNLIVNAAQALPDGEPETNEIVISTQLVGERVIVRVADTGPGIPPSVIGRIFDAFFTTKAVGVGTGLGLAISHRIVSDLGGQLTVESVVGKGTTFQVDLPVARDQPIVAASAAAVVAGGRRGKVLVVDDEVAVGRGIQRLLGGEHDVVVVVTAEAALALCVAGAVFDVIVCDLMMPTMTGMALHAELARTLPAQAAQMIFLTGGAVTPAARAFLDDAAIEHVEKPFDSAALRGHVRRHVRE